MQAERAVTLQQNALSYATLVADADGVVTATLAEPGQVVAAGQAVVTLARSGEPEADVSVPEALLERARTGRATVTLWSQPDKVYAAKLRELTPSADPATRTYPARFTLEDAGAQIELGMSATVTIADASPSVARLPLGAILDDGKGAMRLHHRSADQGARAPQGDGRRLRRARRDHLVGPLRRRRRDRARRAEAA